MYQSILTILVSVGLSIGSFFGISKTSEVHAPVHKLTPEMSQLIDAYLAKSLQSRPEQKLGATISPIAGTTYTLAGGGVSSSATSFTLQSFTIPQTGQKIVDSDMSDTFYLTFDPGSRDRQEITSCTTVVQNANNSATISGCSRGLSPITPYTASTTLAFVHAGGSQVIFSNPPQLYQSLIEYVNSAVQTGAGVNDASTLFKGIVEIATGLEAASTTPVGGGNTSAPLVLSTAISTSTWNGASIAGSKVPITNAVTGKIDDNFISTSTLLRNVSLTGTTTVTALTDTSGTLYGPGWKFIASSSPTVSSNTFDLTNIATSTMLKAYIYVVNNNDTLSNGVFINFNNDTGAGYTYQVASTTISSVKGDTKVLDNVSAGATRGLRYIDMTILNTATTTKPFFYHGTVLPYAVSTSSLPIFYDTTGFYQSTTGGVINRIKVTGTGANAWDSTSVMYLYGSTF